MKKFNRRPQALSLNITSMMDMFTIILVFLLKSFSSSAVDVQISANLDLPKSSSEQAPLELLSIIVDKNNIIVDGKAVVKHNNGELEPVYLDENNFKIIPLFDALKQHSDKAKKIAEQNKKFEFDGKIILQMDKELPFTILRQIMYSAGQAEYSEFKFIAVKK